MADWQKMKSSEMPISTAAKLFSRFCLELGLSSLTEAVERRGGRWARLGRREAWRPVGEREEGPPTIVRTAPFGSDDTDVLLGRFPGRDGERCG